MSEEKQSSHNLCSFCSSNQKLVTHQFILWNPQNDKSDKYMVIKSFSACRECLDSFKTKLKKNNTVLCIYSFIITLLLFIFHFSPLSDNILLSLIFFMFLSTSFYYLTIFLHCSYFLSFDLYSLYSLKTVILFIFLYVIYYCSSSLQIFLGKYPS